MHTKRVFFLIVALFFLCAASAKVGILYLRALLEGSRNLVGFSGVVGVAVVPSSRAHDGDAWWLVRLGGGWCGLGNYRWSLLAKFAKRAGA